MSAIWRTLLKGSRRLSRWGFGSSSNRWRRRRPRIWSRREKGVGLEGGYRGEGSWVRVHQLVVGLLVEYHHQYKHNHKFLFPLLHMNDLLRKNPWYHST